MDRQTIWRIAWPVISFLLAAGLQLSGIEAPKLALALWVIAVIGLAFALAWNTTAVSEIRKFFTTPWIAEPPSPDVDSEQQQENRSASIVTDERGLFELKDEAEAAVSEIERIASRITEANRRLNDKISQHTKEIRQLNADKKLEGQDLIDEARPIIRKAANDVSDYADVVDDLEERLGENIDKAFDAWSEVATIVDEDLEADIGNVIESRENAAQLADVLGEAEKSIGEFAQAINSWPRMSKDLIKAKAKAISVLDRLQGRFSNGKAKAERIVGQLDDIVERYQASGSDLS